MCGVRVRGLADRCRRGKTHFAQTNIAFRWFNAAAKPAQRTFMRNNTLDRFSQTFESKVRHYSACIYSYTIQYNRTEHKHTRGHILGLMLISFHSNNGHISFY